MRFLGDTENPLNRPGRQLGGERPKPMDPVAFWRAACAMLAIFSVAGMVGLYGLGLQNGRLDAMQRGADSDYYRAIAERCTADFDGLERVSGLALLEVRRMQEWTDGMVAYSDSVRAASVVPEAVAMLDE